jgi:hypothetical protein
MKRLFENLGIPVVGITLRNNLYTTGLCGKKTSIFLANVVPWMIAWLLNSGQTFAALLAWSSLTFTSITALFFPFLIYYRAQRMVQRVTGRPQPTIVNSIPRRLFPYWKPLLISTAVILLALVIAQIFVALYYLIVLHQNVI